eukprot:2576301-Pleurochrysis_carterae.AAC.2
MRACVGTSVCVVVRTCVRGWRAIARVWVFAVKSAVTSKSAVEITHSTIRADQTARGQPRLDFHRLCACLQGRPA